MSSAFDASELRAFSSDIARFADDLAGHVRAVVVKGAVNIKTTMRADMESSVHFKRAALDITFDTIEERNAMSAEIGPVVGSSARHAGPLAWIAYFGAPNGGGGTVRDPVHALEEETPRFESALDALLGRALS